MNNQIIGISSNPNYLVAASIGSLFYRSGNSIFRMIDGRFGQDIPLNVSAPVFVRKKYNPNFYKNRSFEFSTEYETWIKISGDNTTTGWQYVASQLPFFRGNSVGGVLLSIISQPEDQQINLGDNAEFSIEVN